MHWTEVNIPRCYQGSWGRRGSERRLRKGSQPGRSHCEKALEPDVVKTRGNKYIFVFVVAQAIISLTAIRKRPPVSAQMFNCCIKGFWNNRAHSYWPCRCIAPQWGTLASLSRECRGPVLCADSRAQLSCIDVSTRYLHGMAGSSLQRTTSTTSLPSCWKGFSADACWTARK